MENYTSVIDNLSGPGEYEQIQKRIETLLLSGQILTSYTGNHLGHTVDFRKVISVLRSKGIPIQDQWEKNGKKRYKKYWISSEYIKTLAK